MGRETKIMDEQAKIIISGITMILNILKIVIQSRGKKGR